MRSHALLILAFGGHAHGEIGGSGPHSLGPHSTTLESAHLYRHVAELPNALGCASGPGPARSGPGQEVTAVALEDLSTSVLAWDARCARRVAPRHALSPAPSSGDRVVRAGEGAPR